MTVWTGNCSKYRSYLEREGARMPNGAVVIADDHLLTRTILSELLRGDGWVVFEARNGVELLALARMEHPDAVVTDLAMPRMGGLEAARTLREHRDGDVDVFVAITGNAVSSEDERELNDVFDHVLRKPVHPYELRRSLASAYLDGSG
ncbi:MAG: response regulator [Gemmatimonadota bacterium]